MDGKTKLKAGLLVVLKIFQLLCQKYCVKWAQICQSTKVRKKAHNVIYKDTSVTFIEQVLSGEEL